MGPVEDNAIRETEADILVLWDRGFGSIAIASELTLRERYVRDVLTRFERQDDWQEQARKSTRRLIAATAATGGCFV